jgi:hypothetical protein
LILDMLPAKVKVGCGNYGPALVPKERPGYDRIFRWIYSAFSHMRCSRALAVRVKRSCSPRATSLRNLTRRWWLWQRSP